MFSAVCGYQFFRKVDSWQPRFSLEMCSSSAKYRLLISRCTLRCSSCLYGNTGPNGWFERYYAASEELYVSKSSAVLSWKSRHVIHQKKTARPHENASSGQCVDIWYQLSICSKVICWSSFCNLIYFCHINLCCFLLWTVGRDDRCCCKHVHP